MGNYNDNILCDVVPMEAYHILLGRSWKFDKKTTHNGLTNEINFTRTFPSNTFTSSRGSSTNKIKRGIENKNYRKSKGNP